jgi:hypothetical protein
MYLPLVTIVLNSIILKYVLENEQNKCDCALTWHHNYIKFFAPVIIFMVFVRILFRNVLLKHSSKMVVKLPLSIIGILSLIYSIVLIVYFFNLRSKKCECSENWKRNTLIYPLVIFCIALLTIMIIQLTMTNSGKK